MVCAAPSLRPLGRPSNSRLRDLFFEISASSLADVKAARGGLDGGEGMPEEGTSGIPLCPVRPGSGVVESLQHRRTIDNVSGGEDNRISAGHLAATITTRVIGFGL